MKKRNKDYLVVSCNLFGIGKFRLRIFANFGNKLCISTYYLVVVFSIFWKHLTFAKFRRRSRFHQLPPLHLVPGESRPARVYAELAVPLTRRGSCRYAEWAVDYISAVSTPSESVFKPLLFSIFQSRQRSHTLFLYRSKLQNLAKYRQTLRCFHDNVRDVPATFFSKVWQRFARFRLYRHRSLQVHFNIL